MSDESIAGASLLAIEERMRRFWRRSGTAEAVRARRRGGNPYTLLQQPLAAAGQAATEQVRLVATADLLARYQSMRGSAVRWPVGWVGHGQAVEAAAEQFLQPGAIKVDLAQFNAACYHAAGEGIRQSEALMAWLGAWPDPAGYYASMTPEAISTVWGSLRRLWDAGRLKQARQPVAFCSHCASSLSTDEAARQAIQVPAPAVWVLLPWEGEPNAYFLVWSAQPWTLVGLVALAIHPEARYALVEVAGPEGTAPMRLLLSEAALEQAKITGYGRIRSYTGKSLRRARYRPLFPPSRAATGSPRIVLSPDVLPEAGTGLMPVIPAFDTRSFSIAQNHNLDIPHPLDSRGRLEHTLAPWGGLDPLQAEQFLIEDLAARGLLFRQESILQPRAHCLTCGAPLLTMVRPVWSVEMAEGPWVVSHDRAWGTPLPIWRCDKCGTQVCVDSLDDLAARAGQPSGQIDPHRPTVDRLTFPCQACNGTMRWLAALVDEMFEATALPQAMAAPGGPANLALGLNEAGRRWLSGLERLTALLQDGAAPARAIVPAEEQERQAWSLEGAQLADAVRWAAYTGRTPAQAEGELLEPLWQLVTPAGADTPPAAGTEPAGDGSAGLLASWLMARLHQGIGAVTAALDAADPPQAAGEVAALIGDLCRWCPPHSLAGRAEILEPLCRLLAPFLPHLAEALHRQIFPSSSESVHEAGWAQANPDWANGALLAQVAQITHLVALGQKVRDQAGISQGRTLPRAMVRLLASDPSELAALAPFQQLLAERLRVKQLQLAAGVPTGLHWELALSSGRTLERRGSSTGVAAALASLRPEQAAEMVSCLQEGRTISLDTAEQTITLLPDEVDFLPRVQTGWAAAADREFLVALELE